MDYGIDISNWQGDGRSIGWPAVRDDGIQFVCVELADGTFVNPYSGTQVDGARGVGLAAGGYYFARSGSVADQVDRFVRLLDSHGLLNPGSLLPMLDMEDDAITDADGFVSDFVTRFQQQTGTGILVYANRDWFRRLLHPDRWVSDSVWLWLADYNGDPGDLDGFTHPRLAIHQHTSIGVVPGFVGFVDRDETVNGWNLADLLIGDTVTRGIVPGSWPAGQGRQQVICAPVGRQSQIIDKAWFSLTAAFEGDAEVSTVVFIGENPDGSPVYLYTEAEFTLAVNQRRVWELPDGTRSIAVGYNSLGPVGWSLEYQTKDQRV